jgi:prepilin-type N-terminal cleavage/methylation domain-containing protein
MLLPARNRDGFTLIELLLVVSIIAIITGGIVPAFSTYMQDQDLTQAQEQLKNDLRSVQNRALTGAMSESEVGSNRVRFWGVQFSSLSASYDYFITDDDSSCPPAEMEVQGAYSLPGGMVIREVTFGDADLDGCIFFSFLNGDMSAVNMTAGGGYVPIVTGEPLGFECRRIELNASGLIRSSLNEVCI